MKIIFLLLTLTFSLSTCFAQNLVLNPSFEEYDTCPNNVGQIKYAVGWNNCGSGTPEYYNILVRRTSLSLVINFLFL